MIDWQTIDTVLLDMDGTLLDLHFDNYFWLTHLPDRYAEAHQMDRDKAEQILRQHIQQYEGTLRWYCLDHWSELVDMDITLLKEEVKHKIQARPYAEEFLRRLKQLNKKLILATNAHPKSVRLKLDITNIDQWLDIVISSHDFGSPKEEQHFWQQLQEREAFDPERTLFIDDTVRVLRSAQQFGIAHLVCINKPDSQKPSKPSNEFLDIDHFDQILPHG